MSSTAAGLTPDSTIPLDSSLYSSPSADVSRNPPFLARVRGVRRAYCGQHCRCLSHRNDHIVRLVLEERFSSSTGVSPHAGPRHGEASIPDSEHDGVEVSESWRECRGCRGCRREDQAEETRPTSGGPTAGPGCRSGFTSADSALSAAVRGLADLECGQLHPVFRRQLQYSARDCRR